MEISDCEAGEGEENDGLEKCGRHFGDESESLVLTKVGLIDRIVVLECEVRTVDVVTE